MMMIVWMSLEAERETNFKIVNPATRNIFGSRGVRFFSFRGAIIYILSAPCVADTLSAPSPTVLGGAL